MLDGDALCDALVARISRQDISGCSFSFTVNKDRWELAKSPTQLDRRVILSFMERFDVGPVTRPAFPDTLVGVLYESNRSAAGQPDDDVDRLEEQWSAPAVSDSVPYVTVDQRRARQAAYDEWSEDSDAVLYDRQRIVRDQKIDAMVRRAGHVLYRLAR